VIAGGAFYGGMAYAQTNRTAQANLFQGGSFSQQAGGGRAGRGAGGAGGFQGRGGIGGMGINGQILSMDDKSLTIQLANGGSQFVFFSPTTPILKFSTGTTADLQKGVNVSATGTTNSDGSVTAQMIQIRPAGMNFPGFGGGSQQMTPGNSTATTTTAAKSS